MAKFVESNKTKKSKKARRQLPPGKGGSTQVNQRPPVIRRHGRDKKTHTRAA